MRRWLAPLCAVWLLTGCQDERIIEKVGFARTFAFDTAGDDGEDKVRVTMSMPGTQQKDAVIYSTEAVSGWEARMNFDRQSDRRIVTGQLRQVLFGVHLASKDIWREVESLMRDPVIGLRTHVLLVDGDPEAMLRATLNQEQSPGEFIDNLIRSESRTADIPDTNLHSFVRDYYDDGTEPVMSILKLEESGITVGGIALFRDGRYVGRIEAEDKMYFNMLRGNVKSGKMFLKFPAEGFDSEYASFQYFTSRRQVVVRRSGPAEEGRELRIRIHLFVKGSLLEYKGDLNLERPKEQNEMEAEIAAFIRSKCDEQIQRMQQLKSDAIGIGQRVRNSMTYREWKRLQWDEAFANADIEVKVTANIRSYGKIQ